MPITSIIMAAGRGSRMKGYTGNKTLLPLVPGDSPYKGSCPILLHIIGRLPGGSKGIIVNHQKDDVIRATKDNGFTCIEQPVLNGTGGALLAAREFIEETVGDRIIVTMGDVPFVSEKTYAKMIDRLDGNSLVILGFIPEDKKQYGILDITDDKVSRIVEWKYWRDWPEEIQTKYAICNAGIYAFKKKDLVRFLPTLASRPQKIYKVINGEEKEIEEFFITDIVEFMVEDGLSVGYAVTENETEAMGIDDPAALKKAQKWYRAVMGDRR